MRGPQAPAGLIRGVLCVATVPVTDGLKRRPGLKGGLKRRPG
ncbi:hypothetical protein SFR_2078 [Streptomyces sp. FR-008]|nr:hypothetical protein SFR_2078 [Streptomyces sp. FR-008]